MDETRCQKTMKYKGNLSTELLFPQNDINALTTFLNSTDEMVFLTSTVINSNGNMKELERIIKSEKLMFR